MKRPFILLAIIFAYAFPLIDSLRNVLLGNMAFWYDPARDMLLALDNLTKVTLIGPTSGIPGIFYGPYWIWLLSGSMLISKSPRIVDLIVETIPYFTIFPFVLFQFRKLFGIKVIILIWTLFIFTYNGYATQLWNPNLAPLFFLVLLYLVTFTNFDNKGKKTSIKIFFIGVITGVTFNFHISFGLALFVGLILFFLLDYFVRIIKDKKNLKQFTIQRAIVLFLFFIGFLVTYIPFFVFEYRHGFQQIKTVIHAVLFPWGVVGGHGLSSVDIIENFFGRISDVFKIQKMITAILGVISFVYVLSYIKKNKFNTKKEIIKLLMVLSTISCSVLYIYLTSKNPVWDYHFISVEIIFFFILAFLAWRFSLLKNGLVLYVCIIVLFNFVSFIKNFSHTSNALISVASKEFIVDKIIQDAKEKPYTVFVYNPAIYTYDYAYLFKSKGKDVPYDPGNIPQNSDTVYLIIPKTSQAIKVDYIKYRTPYNKYKTIKKWDITDGTTILKREKIYTSKL